MAERQVFIDRVKGAEWECYVVAAAVNHYGKAVQASNAKLPSMPTKTSPRDLVAAADIVESTCMVRMWAEFETAIGSYRRHITGNADDRISTSNLIDWTAGVRQGRAISEDVRDDVHEVREYRNYLVHERDDLDPPDEVAINEPETRTQLVFWRRQTNRVPVSGPVSGPESLIAQSYRSLMVQRSGAHPRRSRAARRGGARFCDAMISRSGKLARQKFARIWHCSFIKSVRYSACSACSACEGHRNDSFRASAGIRKASSRLSSV
jgi:hypothetical protein